MSGAILTFILVGVAAVGGCDIKDEVLESLGTDDFRLPGDIHPISYDLLMHPYFRWSSFAGEVTVLVHLGTFRKWIPIHVKNLNITSTYVTDMNGTKKEVANTYLYQKYDFWIIELSRVHFGLLNIFLKFNGSFSTNAYGFIRDIRSYPNAVMRYTGFTRLEPHHAREVFPCFDEPALKARFKIRVVRPKNDFSVLSNMNIAKEEPGPRQGEVTVYFEESARMSTYLVCFVISQFSHSGPENVYNMGHPYPIRVYASPDEIDKTTTTKKLAVGAAEFYAKYTGIRYPLPKLDLIALPTFGGGAMENWGLITGCEICLLFNETNNHNYYFRMAALMVSHEIAHQWFGNLVTMRWWDEAWLNEGFARKMSYKGLVETLPPRTYERICDEYYLNSNLHTKKQDALKSSRPLVYDIKDPSGLSKALDQFIYHKGHAFLNMVEGFMGLEKFRKALQKYLITHQYTTVTSKSLWWFLKLEYLLPIMDLSDALYTWTLQMGYPVINVNKTREAWVLTQSRFLADGSTQFNTSESPFRYKWTIPVFYSVESRAPTVLWFKRTQRSAIIKRQPSDNLLHLNYRQLGYYRVNYDKETWRAFEAKLKKDHKGLPYLNRYNLLDDVFNLAKAGQVSYELALDISLYLKLEEKFLPRAAGMKLLNEIYKLLSTQAVKNGFKNFMNSLTRAKYKNGKKKLLFTTRLDNSDENRQLRIDDLNFACSAGVQSCRKEAVKLFSEWIEDPDTPIDPDIRSIVYKQGMQAIGKEEEWKMVWERYLEERNPAKKRDLLESLAAIKDPNTLFMFIGLGKDEANVNAADYIDVLRYISDNEVGHPMVWNFLRTEWPYLVGKFREARRKLEKLVEDVTEGFSTQAKLEEVVAFFEKYPNEDAETYFKERALEVVRNNVQWVNKYENVIRQWLVKHKYM